MDKYLTDQEQQAIDLAGKLWKEITEIVGDGNPRIYDLNELAIHIHAIQHAIMAQAAARLYPDKLRLLGETFMEKKFNVIEK